MSSGLFVTVCMGVMIILNSHTNYVWTEKCAKMRAYSVQCFGS